MAKYQQIPKTDPDEIEALIERLEQHKLDRRDEELIKRLLRFVLVLVDLVERKNLSIKQLRKMIFGWRTEKRSPGRTEKKKEGVEAEGGGEASAESGMKETAISERKRVVKGHGRKPASAYSGAKVVICKHQKYQAGDRCPDSLCSGHLYQLPSPNSFIQFTGRPLVEATQFKREVLRCSACQTRYEASLPEGVAEEKYDATCDATIALMKYAGGLPWYRQARLQESCGVPLPESVAWERCEAVANVGLPVFLLLKRMAGNGEVIYSDDTGLTILSWEKEKKRLNAKDRRGIQMSGMVIEAGGHKIVLYAGGRKHAGENVDELLSERSTGLEIPIQMSDALAVNNKGQEKRIWAKCLAHARRKFYEIAELFPESCKIVLDAIGEIYKFEAETRGMNAGERLKYHQAQSEPVMQELKQWIEEQLHHKEVEPNSALGEAMRYTLRHWEGLTQFLSVPNAPIDNNEAERALKRFVLFRKNSLFFKNEHGAAIGSIILSLIETCRLNGRNPWAYLVSLRKNAAEVKKNPALFCRGIMWRRVRNLARREVLSARVEQSGPDRADLDRAGRRVAALQADAMASPVVEATSECDRSNTAW
jgi:transposase